MYEIREESRKALESVKNLWLNPSSFSSQINENDFEEDDTEIQEKEIVVFEDTESDTETHIASVLSENSENIHESSNDSI